MKRLMCMLPWQKRQKLMDELANRIATRSFNSVWQRVSGQCMRMCPAEARGYVRARAVPVVAREMQVAKAHQQYDSATRTQIFEASLQNVVLQTLEKIRSIHVSPAVPEVQRAA